MEKAFCTWPFFGVGGQAESDEVLQIFRVKFRDSVIVACDDLFLEGVDVAGHEGRTERSHLVKHAAQGPNIAFGVVRKVGPDFRTGVVGRSGLCAGHSALADLGDIEVS